MNSEIFFKIKNISQNVINTHSYTYIQECKDIVNIH